MRFLDNLFNNLFGSPPERPPRRDRVEWNVQTTTTSRQVVSVGNGGAVRTVKLTGNTDKKKLRLKLFSEVVVESVLGAEIEVDPKADFPEAVIEADEALIPYIEVVSEGDELRVGLKNVTFESRSRLHVTVRTPTPVHSARVKGSGSLKLNRVEGTKVSLRTSSMGNLTAAKVVAKESAHIRADGAGNITIGNLRTSSVPVETTPADGILEARLTSMGNLSVEQAQVYKAICTTSGAGSLHISGETEFLGARLTSMGSMNLSRFRSRNTTVTSSGMGSARVRCDGGTLDVRASSMGSVTILGEPGKVKRMKSSGMGDVSLG